MPYRKPRFGAEEMALALQGRLSWNVVTSMQFFLPQTLKRLLFIVLLYFFVLTPGSWGNECLSSDSGWTASTEHIFVSIHPSLYPSIHPLSFTQPMFTSTTVSRYLRAGGT